MQWLYTATTRLQFDRCVDRDFHATVCVEWESHACGSRVAVKSQSRRGVVVASRNHCIRSQRPPIRRWRTCVVVTSATAIRYDWLDAWLLRWCISSQLIWDARSIVDRQNGTQAVPCKLRMQSCDVQWARTHAGAPHFYQTVCLGLIQVRWVYFGLGVDQVWSLTRLPTFIPKWPSRNLPSVEDDSGLVWRQYFNAEKFSASESLTHWPRVSEPRWELRLQTPFRGSAWHCPPHSFSSG